MPRQLWAVPRLFPGGTVVIMASGPSLADEDVERVGVARAEGRAGAICINSTFRSAPWADLLHAGDARWWSANPDALRFAGIKSCCGQRGAEPWPVGVNKVCSRQHSGISIEPCYVSHGTNSGHQALNIAVHLGAARILLLGYDFGLGPDGETHHHGDHPEPLGNPNQPDIAKWLRLIETTVEPLRTMGITVINCSRRTAIQCFPRAALETVL